jgi:hypothetical protein
VEVVVKVRVGEGEVVEKQHAEAVEGVERD